MIKRIAITGPESTGKTQLASELSAFYSTVWVPEFAREYLSQINRPYTYEDILFIAQNQFRLNQELGSGVNRIIFCDTELIVTKIWCEVKYGKCHPWILEHIPKQNFDLYLLTDIDIPWEPDPQREHPQLREQLMELYVNTLKNQKFPYHIVRGEKEKRNSSAIRAINELFIR